MDVVVHDSPVQFVYSSTSVSDDAKVQNYVRAHSKIIPGAHSGRYAKNNLIFLALKMG